MSYSGNRSFPAGNPIANALVIIVGALAVTASLVLGFIAFVVLASLVLIFAAIVGLRLWWFNRKLRKASRSATTGKNPGQGSTVIEGEYQVVDSSERRGQE